MKKSNLSALLLKKGIEKKNAEKYVNGVFGCISDLLAKGEKSSL
jgi:nucleoid DNA-binding protein